MDAALPFVVFALFAGVIWMQRRSDPDPPPRARYRDLPRLTRWTLIPACVLCLVAVVGASTDDRFELALLPGGILLAVGGMSLRDLRTDARVNPSWVAAAAVLIGLVWMAIGIASLAQL